MHDKFRFHQVRIWLIATLAIAVFTTTGCTQNSTPSAIAGSPTGSNPSPSAASSASPAASTDSKPSNASYAEAAQAAPNLPRLEGKATVVMTVKGTPITMEIDGVNAPVTAGNFVDLVDKKIYDGLVFHRVVRQPSPFVVQGGDPQGRDPNVAIERLGTGGYTDPNTNQERSIPLEIKANNGTTPYGKTFEMAGLSEKPKLRHVRGALAMARSAYPDSASSQFYITLADLSFLDGNYAVFGTIKEGMDTVDKIQQGDRIESARVTQGLENLKNRK
jgi:peptidyl-prolyl cis-trans isomerase B (cyclophilin B)